MDAGWLLLDVGAVGVVVTTVAVIFIESTGVGSWREALADLALLVLAVSMVGRLVQGPASELEVLGHIAIAIAMIVVIPGNWLRWVLAKPAKPKSVLRLRWPW